MCPFPPRQRLLERIEEVLEQEGLGNIEKEVGAIPALKQRSSNVYRQISPVQRETKEQYYQEISAHVADGIFDNEIDLCIMTLKSEGMKISEICRTLAKNLKRLHRETIRYIIRKYEHRWKIRKWTPHQLDTNWKEKQAIR